VINRLIGRVINCYKRTIGNLRLMLRSKKYRFSPSPSPCLFGIMYHGIILERAKGILDRRFHYRVPLKQFQSNVRYFCRHHEMIGVDDLENIVNWKNNKLIITFDDAYRNVYTNAYPLLKKNKIPAVLFITTGFVQDQKAAWDDRLFYAVKNTQKKKLFFPWIHMITNCHSWTRNRNFMPSEL